MGLEQGEPIIARVPASDAVSRVADAFMSNVSRAIVNKEDEIRLCLVTLLCEGHLLIEDVPGVGKTMLAKSLARSLDCTFRRIQFTPDLLPSDVTGVNWMRRNVQSSERARDFASIVLPTPGTSSIRRWPSQSRVTRQSLISSSLLTIARETFDMNASATLLTASLAGTLAIIGSPCSSPISGQYA